MGRSDLASHGANQVDDVPSFANSPLIVGVSGHRDLEPEDVPRLGAAVAHFINELKRRLPDTELRLLIGMAEGADLLVARTACLLGLKIEAVLPMSLHRYAADFSPDALLQLRELLDQPNVSCIELAAPTAAPDSAQAATPGDSDLMYGNLMQALIRRSSLLLALWDGQSSPLPGGTADTVMRYLGIRSGDYPIDTPIEFVETGEELEPGSRLVYWIPTARSSSAAPEPLGAPRYLGGIGDHTLQMQAAMPAALRIGLAGLNQYNRDCLTLEANGALAAPESLLAALPVGVELRGRSRLEEIDAQYGKADVLAVYFQLRSDRLFVLFGVMTFAMGLSYLTYEKLTESRVLLVAYLFVLLGSLGLYYLLEGKRWFAKHLVCRALAETMRAKFYLRLAGADHLVDARDVLSLSGTDRFHGFGWLAYAINAVERVGSRARSSYETDSQQWRCVERAWIENQHAYFTRKVNRLERGAARLGVLRSTIFVAIILAIMTLFLFGDSLHHLTLGVGVSAKNVVTFLMGFFAVTLGVWELHQNKMATRELLWQYRNQLMHFSRARMQLACITVPEHRGEVLAELGRDSLMESYLWTIHRYHREHEPPSAA